VFPNLKPTKRLISIRLPDDLISEVKQKAKKQDVPYHSPFAPSDFNCLTFKLPVESHSQAQPL
jgi:hypothetical protein